MNARKHHNLLRILISLLPLAMGVYGYAVLEHIYLPDALYYTISLYLLNNSDTPPNLLIEITRWAAPLVTASGVILVVSALRDKLVNYLKYLRGNSVAVYGPESETRELLAALGSKGIRGQDSFVQAGRYILLQEEQDNLAFYNAHREQLQSRNVYMKCSSANTRALDTNLHLFCEEETAARLFWKQSKLFRDAAAAGYRLKLVIIGFDQLGQQLLLHGLLNNLFHPAQQLEYHIFGKPEDMEHFQAIYRQLDKLSDAVVFHTQPWYRHAALLKEADRLILCDSSLVDEILFVIPEKILDVLADEHNSLSLLEEQDRLRVFLWEQEVRKLPYILEDTLLKRAKRINLRYANLYGNVEETPENMEKEWEKLDYFTRYSNISAADYHEIRLQILTDQKAPLSFDELEPAYAGLLTQLEHIRWCRYHYLNNWSYGIPANGKNKDKQKRIHTDLIPYDRLSEEDKEKDRENIRILLQIQ